MKWRAAIWQTRVSHRDKCRKQDKQQSVQVTAHNSIKQPQGPRLSIRDAARRHILTQNQRFASEILSTAENKVQFRRRAMEVIPQRRNICERNVSVQQRSTGKHLASIASSSRINCVRNKEDHCLRCQSSSLRRVRCVHVTFVFAFKMVDHSEAAILKR